MQKRKKTVGALASELMQKKDMYDSSVTPNDIRQEMHKNFAQLFEEALNDGIKKYHDDFFIVLLPKKDEKLLTNVVRTYFVARKSCPTPHCDQVVYKYHFKEERIEFLWTLPSKKVCNYMHAYPLDIDPRFKENLNFVLDYFDGTLLNIAKKLNNEDIGIVN